ncbi:MAG: MerR family transcriptional regulator [Lysobacterales bacterium]|jgi:DNA-binding transcriptional MerR regulator/methylmalonyl-CoA mutase cobalamin-binding subunit
MESQQQAVIEQSGARYPIRTVSLMTGVNVITLRAWESRYGLITPERKESGHRLYTQEDIDLINKVVGLLDRGMRIGQVKAFLDASGEEAEGEKAQDVWHRFLDGMLAAVIRFDEDALDAVYSEALTYYDIGTVTKKLLRPLLVELGQRWESGYGTIAEEHFFAFYMRNKLGARFHHRQRTNSDRKVLMACLPGERHVTGLLLLALALNQAGFHPVVLGADMPLGEIAQVTDKIGCEAIVLSGIVDPESQVLESELPGLVSSVDIPVFVGGPISVNRVDQVMRAGAIALGADVDVGRKTLETALS